MGLQLLLPPRHELWRPQPCPDIHPHALQRQSPPNQHLRRERQCLDRQLRQRRHPLLQRARQLLWRLGMHDRQCVRRCVQSIHPTVRRQGLTRRASSNEWRVPRLVDLPCQFHRELHRLHDRFCADTLVRECLQHRLL